MPRMIERQPHADRFNLEGAYTHPYDLYFKPAYGWTKQIRILDEPRLFRQFPQFATWTAADHVREAEYAARTADRLLSAYYGMVRDAEQTYGSHGPLISGIVRDHFPQEVKDTLRETISRANRERDRGWAHWKAAGRRVHTWRRYLESLEVVRP